MTKKLNVIFILGGPGSGKGTQCSLIEKSYNYIHLSAGELLRKERSLTNSKYGDIIEQNIVGGTIVPSYITVSLLEAAMREKKSEADRFLIDGFPRNIENLHAWKNQMDVHVYTPLVLHFVCSEAEMLKRLLKRSQLSGRSDDNQTVIRKRFATYQLQTIQVVKEFEKILPVHHIQADRDMQKVFQSVQESMKKIII